MGRSRGETESRPTSPTPLIRTSSPTHRRCRLPGRDIFNERAGAPSNDNTTTTKAPPKHHKGRTLAGQPPQQQRPPSSSQAFSSFFSFLVQSGSSFALGLLVGTLGALSLVFGLRQVTSGAGNRGSRYRYASRFEGGGRHHVLP